MDVNRLTEIDHSASIEEMIERIAADIILSAEYLDDEACSEDVSGRE